MKQSIQISLYITFSKVMAFIVLILAFYMDMHSDKKGTVFMFAIPFVVFLITGKQFLDKNKPDPESTDKIINATIEANKEEAK